MNTQELNELKRNRTIPIFDCMFDMDKQLEFYTALGFTITYYQKAPYRFASVKNEFTELSFYGDKQFDMGQRHGGCYIVVPDIDAVYNEMRTNLKHYYGKIPTKGLPRLSKLNTTAEDRRCNITDPSGNTLIVGEPLGDSTTLMNEAENETKAASKFEKAYRWAYRYAYSKEDFLGAHNLLESAFSSETVAIPNDLYYKAKVLQLDVLVELNRVDKAQVVLQEIEAISLSSIEKTSVQAEDKRLLEIITELCQ